MFSPLKITGVCSAKSREVQLPCRGIKAWLITRRCSLEGALHRLQTLRGIMILLHNSLAVEVILLAAIWSRQCEKVPVVRLKLTRPSSDPSAMWTSSCPDGVTLWSLATLLKLMSNYHVQTNWKKGATQDMWRIVSSCERIISRSALSLKTQAVDSVVWRAARKVKYCTWINVHQRQNKVVTVIPAWVKKKEEEERNNVNHSSV